MERIKVLLKNYEVEGEILKEKRLEILREIERSSLCDTMLSIIDIAKERIEISIPSIEELRANEEGLEYFKNLVLNDDIEKPIGKDELLKESFSYLIFTDVENNLAIIAYNILAEDITGELIETREGEVEKLVLKTIEEVSNDITIEDNFGSIKSVFYSLLLRGYTN